MFSIREYETPHILKGMELEILVYRYDVVNPFEMEGQEQTPPLPHYP